MTEDKLFTHRTIRLPPKLKARIENHHRVYETPEGNKYPSVTSVLSVLDKEGIDKWRSEVGDKMADYVSFRATSTGTQMHKIIEEYLSNKLNLSLHKPLLSKAHFLNIKHHLDRIDNILAQEATLYSDRLRLAGTTDCIAEFDGVLSVLDFKTSDKQKSEDFIKKYLFQETCYSIMFEERAGIEVKQLVTIISGADGSDDVFIKNRDDYVDDLLKLLESVQQ